MHVKLKGSPALYLVGFMGCGKSTVGRSLAGTLKWDFVDLDDEIEREAGSKIVEIFDRFGEPVFRVMEHKALGEQIRKARMGMARVVALGGGAFAQKPNRQRGCNGRGIDLAEKPGRPALGTGFRSRQSAAGAGP